VTFVPNEAGIKLLFTDTTSPLAYLMVVVGDRIVDSSKQYVGINWPGGKSDPPQPFKRSGNLQDSIRATEPLLIGDEMQVLVIADPANERDGFLYAPWLRERGYEFVDLGSLQG
jgi:hypothetical protein